MFILDKPNADSPSFIYLLLPCDDGRLKLSTRLKVKGTAWSTDTERPIIQKDGSGKTIFILLNRLSEAIDKLRDTCRLNYEPFTKAAVQEVVRTILGGKEKATEKLTFAQSLSLICEKMRTGAIRTDRQTLYDPATIYNYNRMGGELQRFEKEKGISIAFHKTTLETYYAFIEWCYAQDWSKNYTGNFLKIWKGILKNGYKLGLHKNEIFDNKAFKIISEKTDDIYLTLAEIKQIEAVDLSQEDKRWGIARDWFLIACYSALRASDLKRITAEQLTKDTILIVTNKTDEVTEIPIHPVVRTILKKYKGPPPYMHQNDVNECIKFVARKAKLNDSFLYVITKGGKRVETYYKKWQMCSVHTGRRSFISNARLMGMPDGIIMKIAAIKSARTLQLYDKATANEAAKIAAQHKFFKGE
jgi:integrase